MMLRRAFLTLALALPLAACGAYKTDFDAPLSPEVTLGWRVVDVQVAVPASLTVSEARLLMPVADIVWREGDPNGDRRTQVASLLKGAIAQGARALQGPRPVVLQATVGRFHALTFQAEALETETGVHNIRFTLQARDAQTGEVLAGPSFIQADMPALAGAAMRQARARGETQASQIAAHVAATVAAWLGTGPDVRGSFTRVGI